jgi:glyoxylase-like metal-dependent hydrolase (beta-lactamase superfamily II)
LKRLFLSKRQLNVFLIIGALSILISFHLEAADNLKAEKVGAGTYVVLPKEGGKAFSNSAFIILDDGVFVIDSQPSGELALELISIIKETTDKPIRYLLSTHFHGDHTKGIGAFSENVMMFTHEKTLAKLTANGVNIRYPVIATNAGLSLRYSGFQVQLIWVGRAHTDGDLILYLPTEKVIIAGDVFFNQIIPYAKDANIGDWLLALQRIQELDFEKVIPGHGPVADRTELRRFQELLAWSRAVVDKETKEGTVKEKIIDAAKETSLFESRIANYAHQERLGDLLDKVYSEIMMSRSRYDLQK